MSDDQISETSRLTPQEETDEAPSTDEGIPPAEDSGHIPQGPPKAYGPRGQGRSPLKENKAAENKKD